jgi:hypothetical protein
MRARARILVLVAICASWVLVFSPAAASAHQEFTIGPVHLAVGFGTEPAYAGQLNSVQILAEDQGKPVTDLATPLMVDVSFGSASQSFTVEPDFEVGEFGTPGDYRAWFFPTQVGSYTFHVTGTIGGRKIDVTATSGPKTFSDVLDPAEAQFPPTNAPTDQELAAKLDRETPRLASAASAASDAAAQARTIGVIGIVVGAIGLIVAAVALTRRRKV